MKWENKKKRESVISRANSIAQSENAEYNITLSGKRGDIARRHSVQAGHRGRCGSKAARRPDPTIRRLPKGLTHGQGDSPGVKVVQEQASQ